LRARVVAEVAKDLLHRGIHSIIEHLPPLPAAGPAG
jgi:NAD-dependent oxidoreductase involved in siderophore biosynthesis